MNSNENNLTIDDGFKSSDTNGQLPGVKVALILGIISCVAANAGVPGIVLAIISKNKVKAAKQIYYTNPEMYEADKKTLFGAEKCARIGLILSIVILVISVVVNIGFLAAEL